MATAVAKREPRGFFGHHPLATLREEVQDLFGDLWAGEEPVWLLGRLMPSLDMVESDGAIEVKMDIPGIDAKDLDIRVNGNLLTVSGQRKEEKEERGKTWHRVERRSGNFSRTVTLPSAVKEDAIEAKYRDGVLSINLPKSDEAKVRKIAVKS
ncbi:MAG TPA: Hsp20/alpha crystallin family protein [Pirellulales bacterium]|nr:Hsp20/alpha crystallin family protein [Pirellulales bacterium]